MADAINSALNVIRTDAAAASIERRDNPTLPEPTDAHDASAKLFEDLRADLRRFNESPRFVKGTVEALVDSELIPDLQFHPNMKVYATPTEIDFTDEKTGNVVKVTNEGVTTNPNVWELAKQRLVKSGIEPTKANVVDECMHILNTRYMRENGNIWNIATKDLEDSGINNPTGPQIDKEVSRLAKRNGISDSDSVLVLQPIDTTPDPWLNRNRPKTTK